MRRIGVDRETTEQVNRDTPVRVLALIGLIGSTGLHPPRGTGISKRTRAAGDDDPMQNRIRNRLRTNGVVSPAVLERLAADAKAEVPGPDGIRHQLVNRIRAEIAAGTYLTDERWLAAESRLLRSVEEVG